MGWWCVGVFPEIWVVWVMGWGCLVFIGGFCGDVGVIVGWGGRVFVGGFGFFDVMLRCFVTL